MIVILVMYYENPGCIMVGYIQLLKNVQKYIFVAGVMLCQKMIFILMEV